MVLIREKEWKLEIKKIKKLKRWHPHKIDKNEGSIAAIHEPQCTRGNVVCHVLRLVHCGSEQ